RRGCGRRQRCTPTKQSGAASAAAGSDPAEGDCRSLRASPSQGFFLWVFNIRSFVGRVWQGFARSTFPPVKRGPGGLWVVWLDRCPKAVPGRCPGLLRTGPSGLETPAEVVNLLPRGNHWPDRGMAARLTLSKPTPCQKLRNSSIRPRLANQGQVGEQGV